MPMEMRTRKVDRICRFEWTNQIRTAIRRGTKRTQEWSSGGASIPIGWEDAQSIGKAPASEVRSNYRLILPVFKQEHASSKCIFPA